MSLSKEFHRPPPARKVDLHKVWAAIRFEAARQYELFHDTTQTDTRERQITSMEHGIVNMVMRGAARVEDDGTVLFWNPRDGEFVEYDEDYNELMLDFMRGFAGAAG